MAMGRDEIITKIVAMEWEMFSRVENMGGRADCQEEPETFAIMRHSQAAAWSDEALESYLADLTEAQEAGRNLVSEKYARMMESTSPDEYARIAHLLPPLEARARELIDGAVAVQLEWQEALARKYPSIAGRGRPIRSEEDSPFATSFETYLRGELATYSVRTLELYYSHLSLLKTEGVSGAEVTLEYTVKRYGYGSLEEAEARLSGAPPPR